MQRREWTKTGLEQEALQYLLNNQTDVDENVFFVSRQ
jgi:hypothetical protein